MVERRLALGSGNFNQLRAVRKTPVCTKCSPCLDFERTIMCLGIPMQICDIDGFTARCQAKGVERDVSLFLLQGMDVQVGDYVMVHVGYAIQKVASEAARSAWELHDEMVSGGAGDA